ncbi:MAG: hypothetical protein M1360_00510 [Candidatus Marsarchaeota archaeon]|nr:hypothetical protein [Candidatus Marsarchaeota archaeon]MCL5418407.1 hypothetical protein [Candidatus Marsarchaeota archaeon]
MAQLYSLEYKQKLSRREQLLVIEIGRDKIDAASKFVDYINEAYGISKSSAWYLLNKLKEKGIVDFASKSEIGKPLYLTRAGLAELSGVERQSLKNKITEEFSNRYLQGYYASRAVDEIAFRQ